MFVPLVVGLSYAFQDIQILNPFKTAGSASPTSRRCCSRTGSSTARSSTRCGGPAPRSSLQFLLGLGLALLLNRPFRGKKLVQAVVFLPWAVPTFLAGLTFAWLLNPVIGPLPHWLSALGLLAEPYNILGDPGLAMWGPIARQRLVRRAVLRDHAARGAPGDPARALRGRRDRRRHGAGKASPGSRCPSSRRSSRSRCCCARSGSRTSPT